MSNLSLRYKQLFSSEKYYDCVFHVEGHKVKCHKLILATASPVFEAMFYGAICEQNQDIEILDISADIFKILIDHIYSGKNDMKSLTIEESIELFYAAEKYLLDDLINDCIETIMRKLCYSNILQAIEWGVSMDLHGLLELCLVYFTHVCLRDPQFIVHHRLNYLHISKECIQMIIRHSKQPHTLNWFVNMWCQEECKRLGLNVNDFKQLFSELKFNDDTTGIDICDIANEDTQLQQQYSLVERCYYKARRPFTVDYNTNEWICYVKCERLISMHGIILSSRLVPYIVTKLPMHHTIAFVNEYNENLCIEISTKSAQAAPIMENASDIDNQLEPVHEQEHEREREQQQQHNHSVRTIIWRYAVKEQKTKYNCDLNISWQHGVILSPDLEYEIKLIWGADAYGAEYPCSLQSNDANGIHFRDAEIFDGSLVKGLRYINLISGNEI